jgi:hypothetical protein
MDDTRYEPPDGYMTMVQAQRFLGIAKATLRERVREAGLEVFSDPRNKRVKLLKVGDVELLTRPVSLGKAAA